MRSVRELAILRKLPHAIIDIAIYQTFRLY
jgi:hypothetical protein